MKRLTSLLLIGMLLACINPAAANDDATAATPNEEAGTRPKDSGASELLYGLVMTKFANRSFEGLEAFIAAAIEKTEKNDSVRLRLVMALAKLGEEEAKKAVAYLESWEGNYQGIDEAMRICDLGDLYLYYLDHPVRAMESYKTALAKAPELKPHLYSSLFTVFASHSTMFNMRAMKEYLNLQGECAQDFRYFVNCATALAADGYVVEAKKYLELLDINSGNDADTIARVYMAPIWGWLEDAEKVVEFLEPGLKIQAQLYSPAGFRMYCDWMQQFPAYNALRGEKIFNDMWDRIYEYEPEAKAAAIMLPGAEED